MADIYGPDVAIDKNEISPIQPKWTSYQIIEFLRANSIGAIEKEAVLEQIENKVTGIECLYVCF